MRALHRLLSVLLAAAIAVAGVLAVIEIVAAALDKDPVLVKWKGLVDDLSSTQWKDAGPRVAAAVLIVVGLVLNPVWTGIALAYGYLLAPVLVPIVSPLGRLLPARLKEVLL